jgi:hypothetical protein
VAQRFSGICLSRLLYERERHEIISAGCPAHSRSLRMSECRHTRNEARSQSNSIVAGTPRGFYLYQGTCHEGLPRFGLTSFLGIYYWCKRWGARGQIAKGDRPNYSLGRLFHIWNTICVAWDVEFTGQFETWWNALSEDEQVEISAKVELLQERGPTLPRPHADVISTSRPPT